ncbi:sugar-binding transcriptional regulator [Salipiger marinus]|jgi:DNA-binding transcriptional regulator LsrR (DeoR family)|uniref:DNA-binding transcriptional regulator LsrR, DeoR family n=1 Tax=Salipiger marinus TaxID=555512 RepID=A0A1G8LYL3_9RHOB|nr:MULTISPECIES: sugar-binding domain-containing protein [Salipiger]HBM61986.1 transcriptional regulator [Citreicella sp.]MCD1619079.1 transcriptional regulator [Salipiger manganoxidans]MEB3420158.1 sugar-binding domain-containing protein [Salipiger manganoxidans]SDI60822.1 DNA-binding transcriptional regulator LsrR, DeoR family [Salipiger marinus]HBT01433.1 transcriptional regulator [Citreicella sp.]
MLKEKEDEAFSFVSEVCWHYYINGMTQAEIGTALGVTRLRVNQAIQKAKALGIVKVQIESPFLPRVEQQNDLRAALGLDQVLIAPANRDQYDFHTPVGAALASFLSRHLETAGWQKIGVSWGMTLQRAITHMARQNFPDLEIISMIGGTTKGAIFNSFGIASGFAERLGASYSLLAAPIFLSEGIDREAFLGQEIFREHLAKFEQLDAAILTASDISARSYLVSSGLPSTDHAERLLQLGAIGDVVGRFLDAEGHSVTNDLDARTIGITLDTLAAIPEKILVAAGPHKVNVIRAAARHGLVTMLITDDVTADLLLATA